MYSAPSVAARLAGPGGKRMLNSFFLNRSRMAYAWGFLALLLTISWYNVELSSIFTRFNRDLYNALQNVDGPTFWGLFLGYDFDNVILMLTLDDEVVPTFIEYVSVILPISAYAFWQTRRYTFAWREANTRYYLGLWEGTSAQLEGASQRMQEDLKAFGTTLYSLFTGFFSATWTLIIFLPQLWEVSEYVPVETFAWWPRIGGEPMGGFLVWVALGLTIAGMLITLLVGWRLPRLEYQNEKVEAHFRKELVLSEDTLSKRIESELFPIFVTVRRNYYRLFNWSMGMDVWQTLFGLLAGNVALFFLANAYFEAPEVFALGMLTQSLQFFARVEGSMTYFIDRWPMLVGFIAVVIRLIEFERSVGVEALAARARAARQAGE
ncbi:MAG: hypothetical protein RLZ26_1565 [Pseudomonadota bacterium]|jgi:peptide/bleomycin uptake transporter